MAPVTGRHRVENGLFQLFLTGRWQEGVPNRWLFVRLAYQMTTEMMSFAKGAALSAVTADKYGIMQAVDPFCVIRGPMSQRANLTASRWWALRKPMIKILNHR